VSVMPEPVCCALFSSAIGNLPLIFLLSFNSAWNEKTQSGRRMIV